MLYNNCKHTVMYMCIYVCMCVCVSRCFLLEMSYYNNRSSCVYVECMFSVVGESEATLVTVCLNDEYWNIT